MDNIIVRKLVENITNIVTEELCISDKIVEESNKLEKTIINDLKNAKKKNIGNAITYKEHIIRCNIFNTDVTIHYRVYTFGVHSVKNKLIGRIDYTFNDIDLYLNLAMTNGQPINAFFGDTIYHEITHLYQYIRAKKETLMNNKEQKIYNVIANIFSNSKKYTEDIIVFANALYISFDFEQDAMIHGLYARIIKNQLEQYYISDIINNSAENEYLYDLKWSIDNIDLFSDDIFGINKNVALLRFKNAYDRYSKKLGKIIIRAKKDINEKYKIGELIPYCPEKQITNEII